METRICSKCKIEKNLTDFSKSNQGKYGVRPECKSCNSLYTKKRREKGAIKAYKRQKSKKDNEKGKCQSCKQKRLATSKFCIYHFVYMIVNTWKLPKEEREPTVRGLIKKLEDSEFCCHYSGLKITPGFSASVDHRVPQAKGGTHKLNNLVWCHSQVNKLKGYLSEKEFINRSANILVELNYLDSKGEL